MKKKLIFFIIAGLVSFMLERETKSNCRENLKTLTVSLLHNFASIYLVFGSIFGYHFIHLIILTITVAHWFFFPMCILTKYYNNLCKISRNRPFHDIFYIINKYLKVPYFRYILVLLIVLYDIIYIYKNN